MSLKENLLNFFGKKIELNQQPKTWNYDQFKAYLLLLSHKPEATLLYNQYPRTIQLSKNWHELFNQTRNESKDKYERYAIIGYGPDFQTLYLSSKAAKGTPRDIPNETAKNERDKAIGNNIEFVGDIHSHWIIRKNPLQIFSIGDLHHFLVSVSREKIICLVAPDSNLLAFPSKETDSIPRPIYVPQELFIKIWKKQSLNSWDATMKIAQRHKLVIYSGKPNKELRRITT